MLPAIRFVGGLEAKSVRLALSESLIRLIFVITLVMTTGAFLTSCEQIKSIKDEVGGKEDTSDLIKEVERLYKEARDSEDQVPANVADWVKQDVEKLGDWEYKVVSLPFRDTGSLEDRLNQLGRDRWEVFWVEPDGDNAAFYLKRPARSYIRSIPLSSLLKAFPGVRTVLPEQTEQ